MMFSTKGRYALRVMIDLAEHNNGTYIPMKDVADRQNVSLKYLEKILPVLVRAKLIDGQHGKGGGYKLTREPSKYTVFEILTLVEGSLAPIPCLEDESAVCERAGECKTLPMWTEFYNITKDYFENKTIADLTSTPMPNNYII